MKRLVFILLILMSFTGVSLGVIGKAMLTPFHIFMGFALVYALFYEKKTELRVQVSLLPLLLFIIISNLFIHSQVRLTSVIYTLLLAAEYLIIYRLMVGIDKQTIVKALGWIQILYFVNVSIALVCIKLGVQLPDNSIINIYYGVSTEDTRPMGFSSEPSYAAFILAISLLAFNMLRGHRVDRYMVFISLSFVGCIVMMGSAYGFLFLGLQLLDWAIVLLKRSSINTKIALPIIGLVILMVGLPLVRNSNNTSIQRIDNLITGFNNPNSTAKKKLKHLQETDGSAFARIGPTYMMIYGGEDININWIIGAGAGQAGIFFKNFMKDVISDEDTEKLDMGIIPAFIYDYGILGIFLLLIFLLSIAYNLPLSYWLTFGLILPNCNINTQMFWFALAVCAYVSIYLKPLTSHS